MLRYVTYIQTRHLSVAFICVLTLCNSYELSNFNCVAHVIYNWCDDSAFNFPMNVRLD